MKKVVKHHDRRCAMKKRKNHDFDSMCLVLVEHFYPDIDEEKAAELAQRLQDCVEDFGRALES
jgi:hypothetical protein